MKITSDQLVDAKVTNDALAGELRAAATKHNVEAIHKSKGVPLPANADEKARLDAYERDRAQIAARMVKLPRCTLGDESLFDDETTYAQLALKVDPPEAMKQANQVVEIVKKQCGG